MGALLDTIQNAIDPGQRSTLPPGYDGTIPASKQLDILMEERRRQAASGSVDPQLENEIAAAQGKRFPKPVMSQPRADTPTAVPVADERPSGGLYDTVASAIAAPPQPQSAPKTAPAPKIGSGDPVLDTAVRSVPAGDVILNQLTGLGTSIAGGWAGLARLATGGTLDDAVQAVHNPTVAGGLEVRPYETGSVGERALNAAGQGVAYVADKGGQKVMDVTGSPALATAADVGIQAGASALLGKVPGAVGRVVRAEPKLVGSSSIAEVAKPGIESATNYDIPTVLRRRAQAAPAAAAPAAANEPVAAPVPAQAPLTLAPREATPGRAPIDAAEGQTPPQVTAAAAEAVAPEFAEESASAKPGVAVPPAEQARRAEVLRAVGMQERARESAITGDPKAAATDYQQAKLDNPGGQVMLAGFEAENQALSNHAEQIVRDTGGTVGTDAQTVLARGNTILAPLDSLKDWFDTQTKKLYQQADARAAGVPAEMPKTQGLIGGDQAEFLGTIEGEALLRGVKARMKSLGMVDENGAPQAATVQQAEQLKQYLNNVWQPRTSRLIRSMKDAIDDDVTTAAGTDIYAKARAMRAMRGSTLDDPRGVAKIMDADGPEGINRAVPVERIPDTIAAMPTAQFAHIVETLKHVPAELQPQAQAALSEVKAHMANRVLEAGQVRGPGAQWRARDVSTLLNKYSSKLPIVFSPDEIARFKNLNDAGQILRVDTGYPGAAAQTANLMQRGAITVLPKAGAMLGATLGSLVGAPGTGALIGEAVGSRAAGGISNKAALEGARKRFVKLSDFPK